MTAREAADLLGVTESRIYKRKAKFGGRRTPQGWVFDRDLVEAERAANERRAAAGGKPAAQSRAQSTDGAVAAEVFEEFKAGLSPVDVVIKRKIDPETVKELAASYFALKGGLYLSGADVDRLHRLNIGVGKDSTAGVVVTAVENIAVSMTPCVRCHNRPPKVCEECARPPKRR